MMPNDDIKDIWHLCKTVGFAEISEKKIWTEYQKDTRENISELIREFLINQ